MTHSRQANPAADAIRPYLFLYFPVLQTDVVKTAQSDLRDRQVRKVLPDL